MLLLVYVVFLVMDVVCFVFVRVFQTSNMKDRGIHGVVDVFLNT